MALSTSSAVPPDAFAADAPSSRRPYTGQSPSMMEDSRSSNSPRVNSKRPSGSGNTPQPETPQMQHRSPNSAVNSSGSNSTARPAASHTSPRTPTGPNSSQMASGFDSQGGPPIAPPPRTSSNKQQTNSVPTNSYNIPDRTRQRGDEQPNYNSGHTPRNNNLENVGPSREHRNVTVSPGGIQGSASARERTPTKSPAGPRDPRPGDVTRENSAVIARHIITDPEVDVTREKERLAEAIPAGGKTTHGAAKAMDEATATGSTKPTPRSRQDFSASAAKRKETRFGEYILGQTIGEGEFGKVKLGWKKDGTVEVAIKLLRRENLQTNPSRIPKIHREINILRGLAHSNIVRLHEMVETERHIGIIMEYASGGELFDYILTHRYLKDSSARKLFAQLVSGVGYLHKKGIVHRDLKLENLLLDRNRNIIITDFGFANTFDPRDVLTEEIEYNLTNREFVKKMDLEKVVNGYRRGDLMQTSCGSPCYAAPELVVTDSLYTGRKVDVWSCGVILYAMLAGYLPFDDDPQNPEGDNINLLYKYIVSTPLTFPEYVSPHARDLLRRILVPDPRKRADLFEVARHSWLSEFASLVNEITSTTTPIGDISSTATTRDQAEAPLLNRSASVREPSKPHSVNIATVGGLAHPGKLDAQNDKLNPPRDGKRRTVQVEYVAPKVQTVRGELSPPLSQHESSSRSPETSTPRATKHPETPKKPSSSGVTTRKPLPQDPPGAEDARRTTANYAVPRSSGQQAYVESSHQPPRAIPDATGAFATSIARPATGGSMSSTGRLPSRGNSYSQPLAPTVAATNAQGRLAQPSKGARGYNISAPIPQPEPYISSDASANRPPSQRVPPRTAQTSASNEARGHRRANTFSNIFSKTGALFSSKAPHSPADSPKTEKKYPPTSMTKPIPIANSPRHSSDSRRPSIGFGRKNSDLSQKDKPRRFSLLPSSFSFKNMGGSSKDSSTKHGQDPRPPMSQSANLPGMSFGGPIHDSQRYEGAIERNRHVSVPVTRQLDRPPKSAPHPNNARYASTQHPSPLNWESMQSNQTYGYGEPGPMESATSFSQTPHEGLGYQSGFNEYEAQPRPSISTQRGQRGVLQKQNRKFTDAWEREESGQHSGSTGAARRVMDFFRRRGKTLHSDDKSG